MGLYVGSNFQVINIVGFFGGRYKVRTCDPCRVKAVLYH
jgi:hypothetical protein